MPRADRRYRRIKSGSHSSHVAVTESLQGLGDDLQATIKRDAASQRSSFLRLLALGLPLVLHLRAIRCGHTMGWRALRPSILSRARSTAPRPRSRSTSASS